MMEEEDPICGVDPLQYMGLVRTPNPLHTPPCPCSYVDLDLTLSLSFSCCRQAEGPPLCKQNGSGEVGLDFGGGGAHNTHAERQTETHTDRRRGWMGDLI